jgi:predicted patatin/cPLA2 family phospholipase
MSGGFALVCGDGGVKGGFIAGAVTALFVHFPELFEKIELISASSASVGSMCYLISHELAHPGRVIWTDELASEKFLKFDSLNSLLSPDEAYNLDYMVYGIFKNKYPLNIQKIQMGTPKFYFPVQNYDEEKVEFFTNSDERSFVRNGVEIPVNSISENNLYELIKASGAAPFIDDRTINVNGKRYMDAATLEPFTIDLPGMEALKKIVILTKNTTSFMTKIKYVLSGLFWPIFINPFRKNHFKWKIYFQYAVKPWILERLYNEVNENETNSSKFFVIVPTRKIGGLFDNKKLTLEDNFNHGVEVVSENLHNIKKYLGYPIT